MWSFVAKKQAHCDPADPADDHKGDWWDHVAYDAEHRLVLAVVPGARSIENAEEVTREVHDRTAGRGDVLSSGSTRVYQIWYRDPTSFGCADPATSNYTNGIRVPWVQ